MWRQVKIELPNAGRGIYHITRDIDREVGKSGIGIGLAVLYGWLLPVLPVGELRLLLMQHFMQTGLVRRRFSPGN